jgi:catechol 2,3-dioxygenase-like lactoylglutathione lyase family enzyme
VTSGHLPIWRDTLPNNRLKLAAPIFFAERPQLISALAGLVNMKIKSFDHNVLTVSDIPQTCSFYTQVLGMEEITFSNNRKALKFGSQKINLHLKGHEFDPKAKRPTPGSADICLIVETSLDEVINRLRKYAIQIEGGPVERTGAQGALISIYIRDPDGNLIELSKNKEAT